MVISNPTKNLKELQILCDRYQNLVYSFVQAAQILGNIFGHLLGLEIAILFNGSQLHISSICAYLR